MDNNNLGSNNPVFGMYVLGIGYLFSINIGSDLMPKMNCVRNVICLLVYLIFLSEFQYKIFAQSVLWNGGAEQHWHRYKIRSIITTIVPRQLIYIYITTGKKTVLFTTTTTAQTENPHRGPSGKHYQMVSQNNTARILNATT